MDDLVESTDYALAQKWAIEIAGDPNQAQLIIPEDRFIRAVRNSNSVSLTTREEKLFGLGLGINPPIDPKWKRFTIERKAAPSNYEGAQSVLDLDIYSIETSLYKDAPKAVEIQGDTEISDFLKAHAPNSSVWPGNPELIFWAGMRNQSGELIAVGAVTMWETGQKVLSSVGTAGHERGKGIATKVVAEMVAKANELGFPRLGLAVRADNIPAKRAYEKVGFILCGEFTIFERD
jgi:ribosomal protein S18 acetylase RimI-like enzyme